MAYVYCKTCRGDGFIPHWRVNRAKRTIRYYIRACSCDFSTAIYSPPKEDGEEEVSQEIFESLKKSGYQMVH